ncbi:MAG TPA: sulfatase [Phycisphaerae bacterium]|nr:sulfatase [Phycisphaerae bacterium]
MNRRPQIGSGIVAALLSALLCVGACDKANEKSTSSPSVFVIVVDAASAAFFGCYGDNHSTSPNIDAFAGEAVLFENAYSQAPSTLLTTTSFLTGTRTSTHRMNDTIKVPQRLATLPALLGDAGFRTCSIVANPFAGAPNWGLDRGYDECVEVYKLPEVIKRRVAEETTAFAVAQPADVNGEVFRRIANWSKTGTFAYIHYLQPHKPYDPPAEYLKRFDCGPADWKTMHHRWELATQEGETSEQTIKYLMGRYRANVQYVDAAIGELFKRMKEAGLFDESLVILTADHGDAFFKHKRFGHNTDLYDDMVRIPLIMKFPKSMDVKPARRKNLAETVDLFSTILDFARVNISDQAEGDSLLNPAYSGAESENGEEVFLGAIVSFGTGPSAVEYDKHAVRVRDYKFIVEAKGREELYNLVADPDEQRNLVSVDAEKTAGFRELLRSRVDLASGATIAADPSDVDSKMSKLLDTLGYTHGKNGSSDSKNGSMNDAVPATQPSP